MNLKTAKEVIKELHVTMKSKMSPEERMNLEVLLIEYYVDEIVKQESIETLQGTALN